MTVQTALQAGQKRLERAGVAAPRLTAEVLLAHALERDRSWLYGHSDEKLATSTRLRYEAFLEERAAGLPTQYITGKQEFWGREFRLSRSVLIPRPESEHVIEVALRRAPQAEQILDVGCGSGILAVTLALELHTRVLAVDLSPAALHLTRENASLHRARVSVFQGDLLTAVHPASLDLIVSNPPYVAEGERDSLPAEVVHHEPALALFAGPTGLEVYQRLIPQAWQALRPGGLVILELGHRSLEPVRRLLADWRDIEVEPDLAGLQRVISARRP